MLGLQSGPSIMFLQILENIPCILSQKDNERKNVLINGGIPDNLQTITTLFVSDADESDSHSL